jgi:hypothetical protein
VDVIREIKYRDVPLLRKAIFLPLSRVYCVDAITLIAPISSSQLMAEENEDVHLNLWAKVKLIEPLSNEDGSQCVNLRNIRHPRLRDIWYDIWMVEYPGSKKEERGYD